MSRDPAGSAALAAVCGDLRCPHCGADLRLVGGSVECAAGHTYDVARHGHVSLAGPGRRPAAGDSEEMVAARAAFLGAGHFAPIARAVSAAAGKSAGGAGRGGCVVDVGAGTGYYLAWTIRELGGRRGVALDSSRPALRRAIRADPAIAGVVCDAWGPLPVRDGAADVVLSVFAPRNAAEIARILTGRGALVVVTPGPGHLGEIVSELGMIGVDPDKPARLEAKLAAHLREVSAGSVDFEMTLDHAGVRALAGMGPSAHHIDRAVLDERVAGLPAEVRVTAEFVVQTFGRRPSA
ncbi:MAG TPA: methyltransferase domain-containing protein [Solirubrobacteraceae bacterium]